jgi:hypothetical protein
MILGFLSSSKSMAKQQKLDSISTQTTERTAKETTTIIRTIKGRTSTRRRGRGRGRGGRGGRGGKR